MQRRDYRLAHAGLDFHVTEWGSPQGLPVVMLHGIRGYAETFAGIAAVARQLLCDAAPSSLRRMPAASK